MAVKFTDPQIDSYTMRLAGLIKQKGVQYEYIHAVPMGGYPIAVRLSQVLRIPIISTAEYVSFDKKVLVVDDLTDSGKTLDPYILTGYDTAVLFKKPGSKHTPTYYVEEFDDWIVFPWEKGTTVENNLIRIVQCIGTDLKREHIAKALEYIIENSTDLFGCNEKELFKILEVFTDELEVLSWKK